MHQHDFSSYSKLSSFFQLLLINYTFILYNEPCLFYADCKGDHFIEKTQFYFLIMNKNLDTDNILYIQSMLFRSNLLALFVQPHDPRKFESERNLLYHQMTQKNVCQDSRSTNKDEGGGRVRIEVGPCAGDSGNNDDMMLGNHRLRNLILDLR
jgi:hypothetical protein